jgi:hypothetical protein
MNTHNEASEHNIETSAALHRSPKTLDFAKLFHESKPTRYMKRQAVSFAANQTENHGSESNDVLYMASHKRSGRRSLSAVHNQTSRHLDGSSDEFDFKPKKLIYEADEQLSLSIIDREISEWQHTCRTGRPLWWLPESRYNRAKNLDPWLPDEPKPEVWFKEIEGGPDPVYSKARHTVSDSQSTNTEAPNDLAHMIAIQLLGSCFTLPLDFMTCIPSSTFSAFDEDGYPSLPDPRMISSLRMHSHFRYSPCFGHEQRNSSPVQMLPALYDGPSPGLFSPPGLMGIRTTPPKGDKSLPISKRHKEHRGRDMSGASATSHEGRSSAYWKSQGRREGPETAAGAKEWCLRNGINKLSRRGGKLKQRSSSMESLEIGKWGRMDGYRISKPGAFQRLNYRLQPVIRSEPHPVFVQPVKELVVKRWKTFRRRFGGSLHGALRSHESDETESGPEYASPGMSSDAKTRLLRAQKKGDIHSGSLDGPRHFNSASSESLSPAERQAITPYWVESNATSPRLPLSDPLAAAAALAFAERISASPQGSTSADLAEDQPACLIKIPKRCLSVSGPSSSSRRYQGKDRGSMLSEMHTPEDFGDEDAMSGSKSAPGARSGLSAAGSIVTSPMVSPQLKPQVNPNSVCFQGALAQLFQKETLDGLNVRRPKMSRTSTSGTQVFSPGEDGVEVNQLPVGPERDQWDGKGKRRKQTFL